MPPLVCNAYFTSASEASMSAVPARGDGASRPTLLRAKTLDAVAGCGPDLVAQGRVSQMHICAIKAPPAAQIASRLTRERTRDYRHDRRTQTSLTAPLRYGGYAMGSLSPWHWAIVAVVIIVLFGAKRLPDAARSLGKSMRIFKSEIHELHADVTEPVSAEATTVGPEPVHPVKS